MTTYHSDNHVFNDIVSVGDGFGCGLNIKCVTVEEETDSGAITHVITGIVPARARVLGVAGLVLVPLDGASLGNVNVGDGTDADLYGASIGKTAGSTFGSHTATASPLTHAWSTSAGNIVFTGSAGVFETGVVRVSVYYVDTTAPQG